jgi:hypothetical protein
MPPVAFDAALEHCGDFSPRRNFHVRSRADRRSIGRNPAVSGGYGADEASSELRVHIMEAVG